MHVVPFWILKIILLSDPPIIAKSHHCQICLWMHELQVKTRQCITHNPSLYNLHHYIIYPINNSSFALSSIYIHTSISYNHHQHSHHSNHHPTIITTKKQLHFIKHNLHNKWLITHIMITNILYIHKSLIHSYFIILSWIQDHLQVIKLYFII